MGVSNHTDPTTSTGRPRSRYIGRWAHAAVSLLSVGALVWTYGMFKITRIVFSDLSQYGIDFNHEAYRLIIAIAEKQVLAASVPVTILLLLALIGWGICVWRPVRRM